MCFRIRSKDGYYMCFLRTALSLLSSAYETPIASKACFFYFLKQLLGSKGSISFIEGALVDTVLVYLSNIMQHFNLGFFFFG